MNASFWDGQLDLGLKAFFDHVSVNKSQLKYTLKYLISDNTWSDVPWTGYSLSLRNHDVAIKTSELGITSITFFGLFLKQRIQ